jgi:hypothetical protein
MDVITDGKDSYKSYNVKFLSAFIEDKANLKWVQKMNNQVLKEMLKHAKIPFSATLAGWLLEKVVLNAFTAGGTFKMRNFVADSNLQELVLPASYFYLFRKFSLLNVESIAKGVSNVAGLGDASPLIWPMNVLLMPSVSNHPAIDAMLIYRSTEQEPLQALLLQITLNTAHSALSAAHMKKYLKHLTSELRIESDNISLVTVTTSDRIKFMNRLKFDGTDSSAQELEDLKQFAVAVDVPFTPETLQDIASVSKKRKRLN